MDLHELLAPIGIEAPHIEVTDMVLDSRDVGLNSVFVAINGHQMDGRTFIPQAISLGAKVIITEADSPEQHGHISMREHSILVDVFELPRHLSSLAQQFFGHPANAMDLVAITGTNGKTSTAQLVAQIGHLVGRTSGTVGTLGAGLVGELTPLNNTTPDAVTMQRLLAKMKRQGAQCVAYEASSHALVQGRIDNLNTKVAVFTNLSRDHLDYHGSMKNYAAAKLKLREQYGLSHLVFNQEDPASKQWLKGLCKSITPIQFGFDKAKHSRMKYVIARDVHYAGQGTSIVLDTSWGTGVIRTQLLGAFNVLNVLAAIASQLALAVPLDTIIPETYQLTPVPGRMELFCAPSKASIVVDYAHTPDALEKALQASRQHCTGDLWIIFGCGGDRDKGKRPLMGEVAETLADHVVLTNDNVRSESAESIIEDILAGCLYQEQIAVELSREQAIANALNKATSDDVILVAGKGHEQYQIEGETVLPYDERSYVASLMKEDCYD